MAESCSATVEIKINSTMLGDPSGALNTPQSVINKTYTVAMTNGTGANKAEQIHQVQGTISASGTDAIDVSGTLTNAFGTTVVFTKIKGIILFAATANTNDVEIISDPTNGLVNWCKATSDGIIVEPGGMFALISPSSGGYAVTAATGDLLNITNSAGGTSVTYDLWIIGETT